MDNTALNILYISFSLFLLDMYLEVKYFGFGYMCLGLVDTVKLFSKVHGKFYFLRDLRKIVLGHHTARLEYHITL